MKYLALLIALVFANGLLAQAPSRVPEPQYVAIDSKDNVYVAVKYGILRIAPDGTLTNLTTTGELDRNWKNLIIDSKDNLYANDGKLIYRFNFEDGKFVGKLFAGQKWSYKLEDGPIATAGFNTIDVMAIDQNDSIYILDSFDSIKDTIGANFVTDPYFTTAPVKTRGHKNFRVIRRIDTNGIVTTLKTTDGKYIVPNNVFSIAIDSTGSIVYSSHGRFIGKIDLNTGAFSSIAGQPYKRQYCPVYTPGALAVAELFTPENVIVNKRGEIIYADQRSHHIVKIAGGKVSTLAGSSIIDPCSQNIGGRAQEGNKDGKALTSLFYFPKGMAYDSKENLYVADMFNHSIRKLSPDGTVSTFAK